MLNKDYITPALGGRLGNNLFMIAHAYAKGLEFNKQVVIAKDQVMYEGNDYSKNIFSKLEMKEKYEPLPNINRPIPSNDQPTLYSGYYQSETYFEKYSENIKSLFGPPLEFIQRIQKELPFLFEKRTTVINVRRGDYLYYTNYHPTISVEYIKKAEELILGVEHILIISDDIPWCEEKLLYKFPKVNVTYTEGYPPEQQLWIMSMCSDFILSNSSFSWWGAYLSRSPNKTVIAPQTWFGPEYEGSSWHDIYCKGWTILSTRFENGFIYPI